MKPSEILSSPLVSFLLTLLLGIIGISLTLRTRREKRPRYAEWSIELLGKDSVRLPELQVLYSGKAVSQVTASRIVLWNAGTATIERSDIAPADPVRIEVAPGSEILHAQLTGQSTPANSMDLHISPERNRVKVAFDFLDRDQGGVIDLLHTGQSRGAVFVLGTIKGAGAGFAKIKAGSLWPIAVALAGGWFAGYGPKLVDPATVGLSPWVISVGFLLPGVLSVFLAKKWIGRVRGLPPSLRDFTGPPRTADFGA